MPASSTASNSSPEPAASDRIVCVVRGAQDTADAVALAAFAGSLADGLGLPLALVELAEPIPPIAPMPPAGFPVDPAHPVHPVPEAAGPPEPRADLDAIAEDAGVDPLESHVETGPIATALAGLVAEASTTLVVVGDEGSGALWSLVTGAPARRVLRDLPAPLLLVPRAAGGGHDGPWRIAAGILDPDHEATVLPLACDLAQRLDGDDLQLFVGEPQRGALSERARALLTAGVGLQVRAVGEDPAEALGGVLARGEADLLVLAPPERGLLGSALRGSIFHTVAAGGHGPILVAPEPAHPD